jgi:KDO2-lipid IV(A) lauroyltransferase
MDQQPGRSFRHRYEGPFFRRLLLHGVRLIPRPVQRLTMPLWASIFYGLLPAARRAAEANLDQVMGPAGPLLRRARSFQLFLNYAGMIADNYAIHLGRDPDLVPISIGRANLLDAAQEGRGVIAVTGHLGMWQLGPFLAEWHDLPPFYMAMAQEPNPLVQEFEARFRERFRIVYTTGSPFSSLELVSILRKGGILGMQMDRHLGGKTIPLPFCGRTAWFSVGPATLSRLTGAPLVPIFFVLERDGRSGRRRVVHYVEERVDVAHTQSREADVAEATARVVAVYERFVRRYPDQWFNFHDFWAPPEPGLEEVPREPMARRQPLERKR